MGVREREGERERQRIREGGRDRESGREGVTERETDRQTDATEEKTTNESPSFITALLILSNFGSIEFEKVEETNVRLLTEDQIGSIEGDVVNPPGTLQSHLSNPVYKSFPAGELATAIPIKINIGIESKTNEFRPAKNVSAKTSSI